MPGCTAWQLCRQGSAGRARQLPAPQHPSVHWKPVTPRLCQASLGGFCLGLGFFFPRPSPLSSGLLLNLLISRRKRTEALLSVYLRPKPVIKINQMGALKQISLICYQAEKKLENTLEMKGIKSVDSYTSIRQGSVQDPDKHSQFHFKMPHHILYHTAKVCSELDWKYFFIFKKKKIISR